MNASERLREIEARIRRTVSDVNGVVSKADIDERARLRAELALAWAVGIGGGLAYVCLACHPRLEGFDREEATPLASLENVAPSEVCEVCGNDLAEMVALAASDADAPCVECEHVGGHHGECPNA